ncbi:MAG: hypothetical protein A2682_00835 [Candidatus Terrybacteria bacterium RIFCSPHIGHO2_01_FULL_58_15]|nr:MAG: hypothetical protein A2682_00835 [Candidatus Terrybacteria bacterium RIFCSPHIGHO2_01_FULL_58_15]
MDMKWVAISGSWRKTTDEIERAVRDAVHEIMFRGDGIVTGGALGVDAIALDEALRQNILADRIKVFLPTTLEQYAVHFRKHAEVGTITQQQAEDLIQQLTHLKEKNRRALIEDPDTGFSEENKKEKYYGRNAHIIAAADELFAFQVKSEASDGLGTLDAVEKAKTKGIPVTTRSWDLRR